MKKICLSLLLTANGMFVSCMEKELAPEKSIQVEAIEKLYNKVLDIPCKSSDHLIQLITHMNDIKTQHGIQEEMMAQYSYNKWLSKKNDSKKARAVLTCLYVKNYNYQRSTTQENIPNYRNIVKRDKNIGNPLAYSLGFTSPQNFSTPNGAYNHDVAAQTYPAFHTLHNSIRSITGHLQPDAFTTFITYIYCNDPHKPFNTHILYRDLKNNFEKIAQDILYIPAKEAWQTSPMISTKSYWAISDLCKLIDMIEIGKTLKPQKQEYDFAYDHSNDKKIVILCHCIKQYNDQRKTKKTPTSIQIKSYESGIPIFQFSLPDSFDSTLLDKEIYAFEEFTELVNKFSLLRAASDENVQECIDQIYPART